ncbi:hypothetical protein SUDANB6_05548 [Streptomyces sp. enrichment culture]|uniref:hypothetical protein n=1 Tax=Streptomyces sp. enrichment culture TaxID=1795815 RepID=UPI003F55874C
MTLLCDAAPADAFDRGADTRDRPVALDPGCPAQPRRSARRPGLPAGGAGRRGVIPPLGTATGGRTLHRCPGRGVAAPGAAPSSAAARLGRTGSDRVRVLPLPGRQTGGAHPFPVRRPSGRPGSAR